MNRRMATIAAGALLAGSFGLANPAQAHTWTCTGTGVATLSAGLGLPLTPRSGVTFTIDVACAEGGSVHAEGTLSTASCGRSSGTGVATHSSGGHSASFSIETAAGGFTVRGDLNGGGGVAASRGSCTAGTADQFTVVGSVAHA